MGSLGGSVAWNLVRAGEKRAARQGCVCVLVCVCVSCRGTYRPHRKELNGGLLEKKPMEEGSHLGVMGPQQNEAGSARRDA